MSANANHPSVPWALLCNGVSLDQRTNSLTIFAIIEQLNLIPTAFADDERTPKGVRPGVPWSFVAMIAWPSVASAVSSKCKLTLQCRTAGGSVVQLLDKPSELTNEGKSRLRLMVSVEALFFDRPGDYFIDVLIDGQLKYAYPFEVQQLASGGADERA